MNFFRKLFQQMQNLHRYPVLGKNRLTQAISMDCVWVVKFAFDPKTKQLSFGQNHDISAARLTRSGVARREMVTATIEITGRKPLRSFELLYYSVDSVATPITQQLRDEIVDRVGPVFAECQSGIPINISDLFNR